MSSFQLVPQTSYRPVCVGSRLNQAQCDVEVGPAIKMNPDAGGPGGITLPDILKAYQLKPKGGK
ncbi:MAG TPA: hypothetical protein VGF18_01995, partial [Candidatus Tumulicola sp.]